MQSRLLIVLFLSAILLRPFPAVAEEDPLGAIRQLSNEIYRLSQEMITHGSEGHSHEIVSHGQEMIQRTETLIRDVEASPVPAVKEKKKPLLASLRATLKKAKEAVRLGEQEKVGPALDAARKASFQAKQTRQQIQAIR